MTKITRNVIVKGSPAEIYPFWADFTNFPAFMTYIKSVTPTGEKTSHWVLAGPAGMQVDWNAEMTRMEENKRIAWNSKDKTGLITTSGQVTFNDLPQAQTEVSVTIQYAAPGGKAGEIITQLFANPEKRLETDLRNFKQMVERELAA
ncbi:MAG: SRPBCC family protein [Anaerolineales bacterium]|nr:SRPBCC family protein [Anaerolineales bacterium]